MTIARDVMEKLVRELEDSLDLRIAQLVAVLRQDPSAGWISVLHLTTKKNWMMRRTERAGAFFLSWNESSFTRDEDGPLLSKALEGLRSEMVHELVSCFVMIDAAASLGVDIDPVEVFKSITVGHVMNS